jgi:hypothetical protein
MSLVVSLSQVFLCVAGGEAKLYDREKVWPSRNHSILSEHPNPSLVTTLDPTKCERSNGAIKTIKKLKLKTRIHADPDPIHCLGIGMSHLTSKPHSRTPKTSHYLDKS